jgi:hypothetical protein
MEKISTLFGNFTRPTKPSRQTERGMLLESFLSRLNSGRNAAGYRPYTIKRLAYKLAGIPTKDLYALASKCADAERRGYAWGAIFFKEITAEPDGL